MNSYVVPPLLAACLNFTLVYWVYRHAPSGAVRRAFLFWNGWLGLWNLGIAVGYMLPDAQSAYYWYKGVSSTVIAWIAPFFLHFVAAITESTEPQTRRMIRVGYGIGLSLSLVGALTPLLMKNVTRYFWGFYPIAGKGEWMFGSTYLLLVAYALSLLVKAVRQKSGSQRNQLQYLLVGAVICFGGGITNFLPLYGIHVYPIGNLMNSVYSLVVAYAIIEYGLMDIRLVFRRGTVYALLSSSLTVVYLSLVAVLQRLFGHYGVQENIVFYTAAFPMTVILAPTMKSRIEPFVGHALFGDALQNTPPPPMKQDMAFIGVLATEMAHELTKPLTHILNAGARLEKTVTGSSRSNLLRIEKEAHRVSEILDSFAMLSPHVPLQRLPTPLADLLEEALTVLGVRGDATIKIIELYDWKTAAFVNPGQIVQVLTNLIQNAWEAMSDGGTLTLGLRMLDDTASGKAWAEIAITDTGVGIPSEIKDRIFEPFVTTKKTRGGRGVGLAISRAMVERHGGTIQIQSPASGNTGTHVVIRLPQQPMEDTDEK